MSALDQKTNNDHDLLFSQIFIYPLRQLKFPIFRPKPSKLSVKPYVLAFSHSRLCRKIGRHQPLVIIWAFLVVLGYPMLPTKFQGHWSIGSGEEDFLKVFTIYGHGGHIGHVTLTVCIYFHFLSPRRLYRKFGYIWSSGF